MPTETRAQSARLIAERRNLGRLHIASSDLFQAYEFSGVLVELAQEEQNSDGSSEEIPETDSLDEGHQRRRSIAIGLEMAMIVAYCRPFLESEGVQAGTMAFRLQGRFLRVYGKDEKNLHEQVLKRRNSEIAHSDGQSYSLMLRKSKVGDHAMTIPIMRNPFPYVDLDVVMSLRSMIPKMLSAIYDEKRRIESQIAEGETVQW